MIEKEVTSSSLIFDKLSGTPYENGSLRYNDESEGNLEDTGKAATSTSQLFNILSGTAYKEGSLQHDLPEFSINKDGRQKVVTVSTALFNKLSPEGYKEGSLAIDELDFGASTDGTDKKVTSSTALFDKLSSTKYKAGSIRHNIGALVQKTGPEFVQEGTAADLANKVSTTTSGAYIAKSLFGTHTPYIWQSVDDMEDKIVVFHFHFIVEMRRQLSGDIVSSKFSTDEQYLYDEYSAYIMEEAYDTALDPILIALDFWIVQEIRGLTHPEIERDFNEKHSWKQLLQTRDI